jgi:nucleoid DNA-binding protein
MAKKKKKKSSSGKKYSLINEIYEATLDLAEVSRNNTVKIKKSEFKKMVEDEFLEAAKLAASGNRVRFPVIGTLVRKEVKARKAGKGVNPFTGEPMSIKARPATKKPRWSFPKSLKETFSNKRYW